PFALRNGLDELAAPDSPATASAPAVREERLLEVQRSVRVLPHHPRLLRGAVVGVRVLERLGEPRQRRAESGEDFGRADVLWLSVGKHLVAGVDDAFRTRPAAVRLEALDARQTCQPIAPRRGRI